MKKIYYVPIAVAAAFALALPLITVADDETNNAADVSDAARKAFQANRPKVSPLPGSLSESVKEKLRAEYEKKMQNARNNQDYRNNLMASTSRDMMLHMKNNNQNGQNDDNNKNENDGENNDDQGDHNNRNASSTFATSTKMREMMKEREEKFKELTKEREENHKEARSDLFKFAKTHIIEQLNHALNNLKQVRSRIQARITKAEQSGHDMTKAKTLLVTADAKLVVAQQSIDALAAYIPTISGTTTSATSTASTTIDLTKPRQLASAASKAIKDARQAFNAVVVEMAHSMGFKFGEDNDDRRHGTTTTGTTTPPTTGTTTPTTATTTATSTNP